MRLPLSAMLAAAALLLGCRCEEERPYTPFQVTSSTLNGPGPSAAPSASAAQAEEDAGFEPREAPALKGADQREWRVDGLVVRPRKGHRLDRGFSADLDGDGQPEAVVWTVPSEPPGEDRGQLWLYMKNAPPAALTGVPPFVPSGPGCTTESHLWRSGPRTATIDVRARCEARLIPRTPTRALVVIAPKQEEPELFTLRVADPAPGETLGLSIDSRDHDEDGRDDVRLTATLHTESAEREVHADFLWLDRPAGLAADATYPRKSFDALGSVEVVRAKGSKTGRAVGERVDNARRLYASVCARSGVARIFDGEGNALACGDLRQAFEWYAEAEVRAAATLGHPHEAIGAALRADWYHAPLGDKAQKRVQAVLDPLVPASAADARTLPVRARERGSGPRWSPLRFDADGSLLVMTASGIERFDREGEPLGPADEEVDPWPLTVIDPSGNRWAGVAFSCDRSEALFLMNSPEGTPLPTVPAGLLSPRPGGCKGGRFPDVPPPTPLVWDEGRRLAMVAGNLVAPLDQKELSPPKGRWFAAGTRLGLLVFDQENVRRWDVSSPADLADCVATPGADQVACVRGTSRVVLFTPKPAP